MNTIIHINDRFSDEAEFRQWELDEADYICSPSRLGTFAACPRKYKYQYEDGIREKERAPMLAAGSMIHTGLHSYFLTGSAEEGVLKMREVYGDLPDNEWSPSDEHLKLPRMETVLRNYADYWETHGTHEPIRCRFDELKVDNLIAGKFTIDDDGLILIGESTLLMEFETPSGGIIWIKGLPDLPVKNMHGSNFIMDHKSTSGWISEYWSSKYQISDQFRWYALMLKELLQVPFQGAVLDAIYVGKYATSTTSKATKFDRPEYDFDQTILEETMLNAVSIENMRNECRENGYFPQFTGLYCGNCRFLHDFCKVPTWGREIPFHLTDIPKPLSILDRRD
jgi:hypothetical protein